MISRTLGLFALCLAAATAVPAKESAAELVEQVRATEIAFAKTLADRDPRAFVKMIAPDSIWLGAAPVHGPDEILASWKPYFDGPTAPFSWHPEIVEVQAGGKLALSTGPVLDPDGKRIATYTSIWRREASGEWKIIFDRGCPVCDCTAAAPEKPST